MSTRQKPLPASCVSFDEQQYWLGLPQIARAPDHLDSSSLWASTWPPMRPGSLVPDDTDLDGPIPVGDDPAGLLTSASLLLRRSGGTRARPTRCSTCRRPWPTWCGRRTPVSTLDRRSVGELLADSDLLAREALLEMSADRAPGMVRGWPQLINPQPSCGPSFRLTRQSRPMVIRSPSWQRWAGPLAVALPRDTGPGRGRQMSHGSRSGRTSCRPDACFRDSLWHPKPCRPTTRPAQPPPTRRYCTRCMSPRTPPRWP